MKKSAYFKSPTQLKPSAIRKLDKDFAVLDFNIDESLSTHSFKASEATKNILVTGETGSGKSNNFILPAVQSFIQNDCPGIVFDIKSDLYSSIHAIAKKENKLSNIMFVGVHDFCEDINIISSIKTIEQLKNVILAMQPFTDNHNAKWMFWGLNDVLDVVSIHQWHTEKVEKKEHCFDFREINRFITERSFTKLFIDKALEDIEVAPPHIASAMQRVLTQPFSLYPKTRQGMYGSEDGEEDLDVAQQRTWRSGQVSELLTAIIKDPFYSKLFNQNNKKTLHDYIYKEGKLLVLTIPLEHESTGYLVAKLLREVYFKAVCQNEIDDLDQYRIGTAFNRYTVLVIDEYQFYINTQGSNGVITDDNWLSISRGFFNINIFATQSISSMYSKSNNTYAVDTIVQNFANKVFLKSSDPATCEHADFITKDKILDSQALRVLLNPYEGERKGIFKLTAKGGVKSEIFDYSLNSVSKYINSDEFKKLKKQSSTILKSKSNNTDEPANRTFRILSRTKNFYMLSNGEHVRKTDFNKTHSVDSLIYAFNKDLVESSWDKEFIEQFITTPENIVFGDGAASYMKKISSEMNTFTKVKDSNSRHALGELNTLNDEIKEIYNLQDSMEAQDIKDALIATVERHKPNINRLANAHEDSFKLKVLAVIEGDTSFMVHFDSHLKKAKIAKISADDLDKALSSPEFRQTEKGLKIVKLLRHADVICLLKCSEDQKYSHESVYNKISLIPTLKKINPDCSILAALGGSNDVFLADLFSDNSFPEWDYLTDYIRSIVDDYAEIYSNYIFALMENHDTERESQSQLEIIKTQEELINEQREIIKRYESNNNQ